MNEPMETCGECRGTGIGERIFARGIDANGEPYAVRETCQSCHGRGQVACQAQSQAHQAVTVREVAVDRDRERSRAS